MKVITVQKKIGEYLGHIDWNFDFTSVCQSMPPALLTEAQDYLHQLESGGDWLATTDSGWPRFGWGAVLQVGMYDGWPHWRPIPSVCIDGPLGAEWHPFYSITGVKRRTP